MATTASITIIITITNCVLARKNHRAQIEIFEHQQYLNDSTALERIYEGLLRSMGEAAVKGDDGLRTILSDSGITISFTPSTAPQTNIGGNNHGKK